MALLSFISALPSPDSGGFVHVLHSDGDRKVRQEIQEEFPLVLARARKTVTITTPYFAPAPVLIESLISTALRGVEIQILTAGKNGSVSSSSSSPLLLLFVCFTPVSLSYNSPLTTLDNIFAFWAAQFAYTKLLHVPGIQIHEMTDKHLHAKTTVIDDH